MLEENRGGEEEGAEERSQSFLSVIHGVSSIGIHREKNKTLLKITELPTNFLVGKQYIFGR